MHVGELKEALKNIDDNYTIDFIEEEPIPVQVLNRLHYPNPFYIFALKYSKTKIYENTERVIVYLRKKADLDEDTK